MDECMCESVCLLDQSYIYPIIQNPFLVPSRPTAWQHSRPRAHRLLASSVFLTLVLGARLPPPLLVLRASPDAPVGWMDGLGRHPRSSDHVSLRPIVRLACVLTSLALVSEAASAAPDPPVGD